MNELTGDSKAGDFLGFAACQQALIEGAQTGIKARGDARRHVETIPQGFVTAMTDGTLPAQTGSGVVGMGSQSGEGNGLFRGGAAGEGVGGNDNPRGADDAHAGNGKQMVNGLAPGMV